MKPLYTLFYFVICHFAAIGQSQTQEGDLCFDFGDYACAVTKYNSVFINTVGKDRQIAEIKLSRAKWCAEHIKLANQAFSTKKYPKAIDEYLKVLETNPKDSFVKNQIQKCRTILDPSKLRQVPDVDSIDLKPNHETNQNSTLIDRVNNALLKPEKPPIVSVNTVLPKNIKGRMRLCGIPTIEEQFQLESAILGSESNYWVVKDNNLQVTRFKGNSFFLLPRKTTTYFLSPDNRPDLNVSFTVEVVNMPTERISIEGPSQLCSGHPFTLTLNGLSEEKKMKWHWYRTDASNSTYRKAMGSRASLRDSIQSSYTYSINAEYDGCPLPEKVFHQVTIFKGPSMPQPNYEFLNSTKDKIRLTVLNNTDPTSAYQWSKDEFRTVFANGDIVSSYRVKRGPNNFYVRYTDDCGIQSPMASISVIGKKRGYLFVTAGVNGTDFPRNISYNLTFGTKSWYLRGKASLPFVLKNQFQTSLGSTSLQISDQSRVTNYPRTSGTYYIVNGNATISRISATTGFLIGTPVIRFYLGGGFGKADILWGLDIHNYSGGSKEREVWAINSDQSTAGPEVESGVFIKIGSVNIMGGASMIKGSKIAKPYGEFQLGIGFNIK